MNINEYNIRYTVDSNNCKEVSMLNNDLEYDLALLKKLALNNNLSKSEMNVIFFCWHSQKTSHDVAEYLNWASPNVARLLLAMVNKGFLTRKLSEDNKSYLYSVDKSNPLLEV